MDIFKTNLEHFLPRNGEKIFKLNYTDFIKVNNFRKILRKLKNFVEILIKKYLCMP